MPRRLEHEEVVEILKEKYGDRFKLLSHYCGRHKPLEVLDTLTGEEFSARSDSAFLKMAKIYNSDGTKRIFYGRRRRYTLENIDEIITEKTNGEYIYLGDWTGDRADKFTIKHKICGYEYKTSVVNFMKGKRCPSCNGGVKKTNEMYQMELDRKYNKEFELMSDYIDSNTPLMIKHRVCGAEFEIVPRYFCTHPLKCKSCIEKEKALKKQLIEEEKKDRREKARIKREEKERQASIKKYQKELDIIEKSRQRELKIKIRLDRQRQKELEREYRQQQKEFKVKQKELARIYRIEARNRQIELNRECNLQAKKLKEIFDKKKEKIKIGKVNINNNEDKTIRRKSIDKIHRTVLFDSDLHFISLKEANYQNSTLKANISDKSRVMFSRIFSEMNPYSNKNKILLKPFFENMSYRENKDNLISQSIFEKRVLNVLGQDYRVVSKYNGELSKIKILHTECGTTHDVFVSNIFKGFRCPHCSKITNNITSKEFADKIKDLTQGEYEVIGTFIDKTTLIEIKHNKCGNAFWIKPNEFLLEVEPCPECKKYHIPVLEQEELLKQIRSEYRVELNHDSTY